MHASPNEELVHSEADAFTSSSRNAVKLISVPDGTQPIFMR